MAERKVSDLLLLMQALSFLSFLSAHQLSVERKVSDNARYLEKGLFNSILFQSH